MSGREPGYSKPTRFKCRYTALSLSQANTKMSTILWLLQALNIQGRLKFLHGQNQRQENGGKVPSQLALFAIATPLQPPSILEIRTKNMIFRTKHKLDFTPLACDAK